MRLIVKIKKIYIHENIGKVGPHASGLVLVKFITMKISQIVNSKQRSNQFHDFNPNMQIKEEYENAANAKTLPDRSPV